ncbi:MAG: hypothetical protein C4523_06945 [Myxococcales bacterium]|nr:MAG: hypothetical protein C4523_06945 [Myxococcales bacterium]
MKGRIFGFSVILVAGSFLFSSVAGGGGGGGSGNPITPYDHKPTLEEIEAQRKNTISYFRGLVLRDKEGEFARADLCYAKGGSCKKKIRYFSGKGEQGDPITIALADLKDLTLLEVSDQGQETAVAKIKLTVFPYIKPKELFENNPSYSDLESKTVVMFVALVRKKDGADLSFGELQGGSQNGATRVMDIKINKIVNICPADSTYWWAIPSVTNDSGYPHRVIIKK